MRNPFKKILVLFNNFFLIPILFSLISVFLFSYFNNGLRYPCFATIVLTLLIIIFCLCILLGITGKSFKAYIIFFIILFIIFIINQIKIVYLGEPLYFSDFVFWKNIFDLCELISGTFINQIKLSLWYLLLLFLLLIILSIYANFVKFELVSMKRRVSVFILGFFGIFILFFPFSWSKDVYRELFFFELDDYSTYTTNISGYSFYGVIGGMFNQMLENRFEAPNNYDENRMNNILKASEKINTTSKVGSPNIIVVLSESFFDVSLLEENIKFDKNITTNFNKLKEEGYLVNLISPSYGGRTVNIDFELLTGGNISYFSSGYIPFMHLYSKDTSVNMPSIVNELSRNDYYSEVIIAKDVYKSEHVFKVLGFNKYTNLSYVNNVDKKGYYVADDYIADLIIDRMHTYDDKYFLFVETMQSHMDYLYSKYSKYDIMIDRSDLLEIDNEVLLSYAQGIYDADKFLIKVYNELQQVEEDTILIFFGDHLPYLGNGDRDNLIYKFNYFNTGDELLNLYRLYNTQALILSNYDVDIDVSNNLGFDLLLTSIINQMDIDISSYYKWLDTTSGVLPAYNRYVTIDSSNKLRYFNQMSSEQLDILQLRNNMMYKLFINNLD